MRHDAIDQAPGLGRRGVDGSGGEQQFGGAGVAHVARQQPRPAVAGDDAQLHEGHAEAGAVRGDADVAQAGDVAAQAHGRAVDGGDQRNLQPVERADDAMDDAAIAFADGRARALEQVGARLHGLEVAAGRKGAARPRHDDATDRGVGVDRLAGGGEGLAVLQVRQGVQPVGPGQGPDHDRAAALLDDQTHDRRSFKRWSRFQRGDGRRQAELKNPGRSDRGLRVGSNTLATTRAAV
ncbi:hypothetical protein D3C80_705800 [compost metagenome]